MTAEFLAPAAERDLYEAVAWLARENEVAADALRQAALQSILRIVERPMVGRLRPELAPEPYRFWRVTGFPYLIVYNAAREPPLVVRVLHMARDLPPLLSALASQADEDP